MIYSYDKAIDVLNKIFDYANKEYFESVLLKPTITIQSSKKAYGHITVDKVWNNGKKQTYELNIGAETLSRSIEETVATMLHEMIHEYCLMNNIKDTSNRGVYHNYIFKDLAERIAKIKIEKNDKYGWTITSPTKETKAFCKKYKLSKIMIHRETPGKKTKGGEDKPKTSTRKYMCPSCLNSFRATKEIHCICKECMIEYELATK